MLRRRTLPLVCMYPLVTLFCIVQYSAATGIRRFNFLDSPPDCPCLGGLSLLTGIIQSSAAHPSRHTIKDAL